MVIHIRKGPARHKDEQDLRTLLYARTLDLQSAKLIVERHMGRFAVKEFESLADEVEWRRVKDAGREE